MKSRLARKLMDEFSTEFKEVSIKTFFGGYTIYSEKTIFGWINESHFYLRGHASYRELFIAKEMQPLSLPTGATIKLLDYYQVNSQLLDDRPKLYSVINMVIACACEDKKDKNRENELRIKTLPNITLSLERLLFCVGINNITTFETVGYLESFVRLKRYKKGISDNLLFALFGAFHRRHVATLSKETKQEIALTYQQYKD
ncbi:TfoX/Sxy family protein [Orbaceae bacterium ESL0721]|nr:TfoX/Sxy family protein [Orbaceae bacterium ESL0721]